MTLLMSMPRCCVRCCPGMTLCRATSCSRIWSSGPAVQSCTRQTAVTHGCDCVTIRSQSEPKRSRHGCGVLPSRSMTTEWLAPSGSSLTRGSPRLLTTCRTNPESPFSGLPNSKTLQWNPGFAAYTCAASRRVKTMSALRRARSGVKHAARAFSSRTTSGSARRCSTSVPSPSHVAMALRWTTR